MVAREAKVATEAMVSKAASTETSAVDMETKDTDVKEATDRAKEVTDRVKEDMDKARAMVTEVKVMAMARAAEAEVVLLREALLAAMVMHQFLWVTLEMLIRELSKGSSTTTITDL